MNPNVSRFFSLQALFTGALAARLPRGTHSEDFWEAAKPPRRAWAMKNLRELRRAERKGLTAKELRARALESMASKGMIPVRLSAAADFYRVGSYKRCSYMELYEAGFWRT